MSDEFELQGDFDFDDDFDEELAEFDDFEDDFEEVSVRTAVMQKNDMIALLCIKTAQAGAAICRVDLAKTVRRFRSTTMQVRPSSGLHVASARAEKMAGTSFMTACRYKVRSFNR
ncbi:MAG: hypothetical protein IPJ55_10655 [Chloracidobacterium sp.]|nr:hypothetical protein [Chloracidobacterium sp.]